MSRIATPEVRHFKGVWATKYINGFTIFEVAERLEAEKKLLIGALEKFRGQFDCHECSGTAEEVLDYLKNSKDL